jgi:hypothetical protein
MCQMSQLQHRYSGSSAFSSRRPRYLPSIYLQDSQPLVLSYPFTKNYQIVGEIMTLPEMEADRQFLAQVQSTAFEGESTGTSSNEIQYSSTLQELARGTLLSSCLVFLSKEYVGDLPAVPERRSKNVATILCEARKTVKSRTYVQRFCLETSS